VTKVHCSKATGPCFARHIAQQLYRDEEYCLSIDSHTRFVKNWDQILISLLAACPSQKPILTTYPLGYELPNKLSTETRPTLTCADSFGADGMLRLTGKLLLKCYDQPLPSLFWVSGFSFSRASIIKEVPYDPHLPFLFFGEESSMVVRLWTHGWDFYAPGLNIVYHLWTRSYRHNFRENKDVGSKEESSRKRVKYVLGMVDKLDEESSIEIAKYGRGNARTLEEYQQFSAVSFKQGKIEAKAKYGGLPQSCFIDSLLESIMSLVNST